MRPDERTHESASILACVRRARQERLQLRNVLIEGTGASHGSAFVDQVLEGQPALLGGAELSGSNSEHRPADDAGFELGAGVDAHDRGAVVERVEVVATEVW